MIHGYAMSADGVDIAPELRGLSLVWGLDHRTMAPIPPAGTATLAGPDTGLSQRIVRAGMQVSHAGLGGVLFNALAGRRRSDGGGPTGRTIDLQTALRQAATRRDAEVLWSRRHPDFNAASDFRTISLQQRDWGRELLAAAYPGRTVDTSACPSAGLAWHPPRAARWQVQDTGRILHAWFGWPVVHAGIGTVAFTPGDLSAGLRRAAPRIRTSDLWIEDLGGGVVEAGMATGLQLDWTRLYADAWPDLDIPALQILHRNEGAVELYGERPATVAGLPPGSPNPAGWDGDAYGNLAPLPALAMRDWTPSGDYGAAILNRAQHRRVATLRLPGVQPSPAAMQALQSLVAAGTVVRLDIDGSPRGAWSGFATVATVMLNIEHGRLPEWTVSLVSLSGAVPGRTEWTLGTTPLPAPVPGPGIWDRGSWDGGAWWNGPARWDADAWDGGARWADEPRWDRAVWDYDYYPTP